MNAKTSYSKKNANAKQSTPAIVKKEKKWYVLLVKFLILLGIVVSIVVYTDKKGYFLSDQLNNHHERRWESFYKLTKNDTIDVVVLGTSHAFTGINPKNLSAALGCNCFVMAFNATTIMDSYYCLEEVLTKTTPKVVVIETYGIDSRSNHEISNSDLSNQYRSFYVRRNLPLKLKSMPSLFTMESYLPAWSSTLRNHELIFKNREEIKTNIEVQKKKQRKFNAEKLYLGRFVRFTSGLEDSTLAKYNTLGPIYNGENEFVSHDAVTYTHKIVELCKKHNIKPVFITIPMYAKHITNYNKWKEHLCAAIPSQSVDWLDLQEQYDSTLFTKDCFENTYSRNQHLTYYGSLVVTYKLAHYLKDSLKLNLPQRNLTQHWNDLFYGEEGYFENYPSRINDPKNVLICSNQQFGKYEVKDCILQKMDNNNVILLKVAKNDQSAHLGNKIRVLAVVKLNGQQLLTYLEMYRPKEYDPIGHYLYEMSLIKEAELVEIKGVEAL